MHSPPFRYLKEFGFTIPGRPIMVDDIRVRGTGKSGMQSQTKVKAGQGSPRPVEVWTEGLGFKIHSISGFNMPKCRHLCPNALWSVKHTTLPNTRLPFALLGDPVLL